MDLKCECLYCGHVFMKRIYYYVEDIKSLDIRCEKPGCNDRRIKVYSHKSRDIFGYNWAPPEAKRGKPDIY